MSAAARTVAALAPLVAVLVCFAYWLGLHQPIRTPPVVAGIGNGLHTVGAPAIAPGRYFTEGSQSCRWQRRSREGVIDAGQADPGRLTWVTIRTDDHQFSSSGCPPWRRADR